MSQVPAPDDRAPAAPSGPLVLIVDPDKLSSMIVSRALASTCQVEVVRSGVAALEVLSGRQVAMLITEAQLADLPLGSLISRMRQLFTPMIPVLVLSTEPRPAQRVDMLRLGVELMAKPVDTAELQVRVQRALAPAPRPADDASVLLAGELGPFSLFDVFSMLDLSRFDGRVECSSARATGCVYFRGGRPYHATWGKSVGIEALAAMLHLSRGWFRARPGASPTTTLDGTTTHVMLAATVDEAHRRRTPSAYPNRLDELGVTKRPLAPLTAHATDGGRGLLARRLAMQLRDPLRLGELELEDPFASAADAMTIVMFGDLPEMIASLWEVSAPVSPETLIGAMTGRRLVWTFAGRDNDRVRVVPVGVGESSAAWIELAADAVIVAPQPGSALSLDPGLRPFVLKHQTPVLFVGPQSEQRALSPIPFSTLRSTGKYLHELRGHTRAVLAETLALIGSEA